MDIPQVNMLEVARSSKVHRRGILGFTPRIAMTFVDYADMDRMDGFYLQTQVHRDYYRDSYNKLHPLDAFRYQGPCGKKVDKTIEFYMRPPIHNIEPLPVLYPLDVARKLDLNATVNLKGIYSKESSNEYNR